MNTQKMVSEEERTKQGLQGMGKEREENLQKGKVEGSKFFRNSYISHIVIDSFFYFKNFNSKTSFVLPESQG